MIVRNDTKHPAIVAGRILYPGEARAITDESQSGGLPIVGQKPTPEPKAPPVEKPKVKAKRKRRVKRDRNN